MDIGMFLVFPGILITIGVGLLILSVIVIIIAYKTECRPDDVDATKLSIEKEIKDEIEKEEAKEEIKPIGITDQIVQEKEPNKVENKEEESTIDAFEEEFGDYKEKEPIVIPSIPKEKQEEKAEDQEEEIELL